MSEEDLELLLTLDDPDGAPEEDVFNHLHTKNNLEYWLDQQFLASRKRNQRAQAVSDGHD
jgi:hypothetical protein